MKNIFYIDKGVSAEIPSFLPFFGKNSCAYDKTAIEFICGQRTPQTNPTGEHYAD
jgi:hypothetical protein